jgi:calcineurin-like phosphoesterase family protein
MEIIAMGDVHGRSFWKKVANTKSFDKLILLGDYFDSFDISAQEQIRNFQEIIAFKEAYPDKMILLIGNHDFHYLPIARSINETYSGFQDRYAYQISFLLQEHINLLQMCYKWEHYLFTHAGVTNTWLRKVGYKGEAIDVFINELFRYKPASFFFTGLDPYGDDVTQSPIWVRPRSLKRNAYDYEHLKQVVGHTAMRKLEIAANRYFFIDTMDSSHEYLILNEEGVRVEQVI